MSNKIKSTVYFHNDKGEEVSQEEATKVRISERDENGNITEIFGSFDDSIRENSSKPYLNKEEADKVMASFQKEIKETLDRSRK